MMLNPKDYRREFEAASLKKVLQERDRIVQFEPVSKKTKKDPSPFRAIEKVISKFDEDRRRQFLDELKVKDEDLYYRYLEWKVNGEG